MSQIISLHATSDGRHIVIGSGDRRVRVWSLADGSLLRTLNGHKSVVWSVHATSDGRHIVSGSVDKTVRVWSLADGSLLRTLNGHTDAVCFVHATSDGRHIVSGSRDKTARVWSLADGSLLRTLNGHTDAVWFVHATSDGRHIVSGSDDKTARVWSLADGSHVRTLPTEGGRAVCITPDAQTVISGGLGGTLRLWPSGLAPPHSPASTDDEVELVGVRSREEIDAAGRKRAIDLNSEASRKRAKCALEV